MSGSSKDISQQHESLVHLFLNSIEHLLHKEDPISFVLNVLLQFKYNSLHSLDSSVAASPMEALRKSGKEPAYMIVSSMLNAAQSAHAHYSKHTVVTLQDIKEELVKVHSTSGKFTPNVCDELFNKTPPSPKPITFDQSTLTDPPYQVSPPSSQSSQESRKAVQAYKNEQVDLMQTPSLLQDTPSLKLKHPATHFHQVYPSPQPMQIPSTQYLPTPPSSSPNMSVPYERGWAENPSKCKKTCIYTAFSVTFKG